MNEPQMPQFDSLFEMADPLPVFAALRKTTPVFQLPAPGFWAVTRYDDAVRILRDPATFSSMVDASSMRGEKRPPTILFDDPPIHTRMRGLLTKAFTPRVIEQQRAAIEANCIRMVEAMCASEPADVVAGLAYPLPVMVIAGMLGVQGGDMATFKRWSDAIIENIGVALFDGDQTGMEDVNREFDAYFSERLAQLRRQPEDNLLSSLVHAVDDDGGRLSQEDLLVVCRVLLVAGNETTTGLIINAVRAFALFPEMLQRLRDEPALATSMVEETLRYFPPFPATIRRTSRDVELSGTTVPKDSRLIVLLASANHDETAFDRPDEFIIDRDPNRHIGFGMGIHYCLGAPLARIEGQIAVRELAKRITGVELLDAANSGTMRPGGPSEMPVRFSLAAAAASA